MNKSHDTHDGNVCLTLVPRWARRVGPYSAAPAWPGPLRPPPRGRPTQVGAPGSWVFPEAPTVQVW